MNLFFRSNTEYLPYIQILVSIITGLVLMFDFSGLGLLASVVIYAFIGCFGISIGYHRYLAHKSFELKYKWMKYPLFWLGCIAGTGSPLGWAAVHRNHHKFSDRVGDPHSPKNIGLKVLLADYEYKLNPWNVRDFVCDKTHMFLHNYYFLLLFIWFAGAMLIGFNVAMYGVIVPIAFTIWVSTISNYVNHKFGYISNKTQDDSRNLWITAVLTFGEGWHNNHHANPRDYQFGKKWWEIDWGAFIIKNALMK